jgi:hypothetical protein
VTVAGKPGTVRLDSPWTPTWHPSGTISAAGVCCWGHESEVRRPRASWTTVVDYDDGGQAAYGLCDPCHDRVLLMFAPSAD